MFQFPALASLSGYRLTAVGSPIRKSPDHRVLARSPRLIAGSCVLHRLLLPRHPPCALSSLIHQLRSIESIGSSRDEPGIDIASTLSLCALRKNLPSPRRALARVLETELPSESGASASNPEIQEEGMVPLIVT